MFMRSSPMLRSLRCDTQGSTAVELAGAAMLLVAGLLNAVDLTYCEYRRMEVENAAEAGAQVAWSTFDDPTTRLPAAQNRLGPNTTITTAIQSKSTERSFRSPAPAARAVNESLALIPDDSRIPSLQFNALHLLIVQAPRKAARTDLRQMRAEL
jgi:TadE-like protein